MAEERVQRGREAATPQELGRGWKDVFKRVREESKKDHISLIAAAVAFYAFFAIFPGVAALVSLYGLIADPHDVERQMASLGTVLPSGAKDVIGGQLRRIADGPPSALGWGFALSMLLTLWSASKGVRGIVTALNIAYDEDEKRGWARRNALIVLLTVGGMVAALVALVLVAGVPAFIDRLGLGVAGSVIAQAARWVVLGAMVMGGLAVLYRVGPSRDKPQWTWVSPGSIVAAVLWLLASVAFSLYVGWFGSYEKTFGSLGAVAILLLWFYIGALVVLLGAELNAEAEHQTRRDTTRGPPEPMGERGAYVADTLGRSPA